MHTFTRAQLAHQYNIIRQKSITTTCHPRSNTIKTFTSDTFIFTTRSPLHAAEHHRFIHSASLTLPPTNMYSPAQTGRELNSEMQNRRLVWKFETCSKILNEEQVSSYLATILAKSAYICSIVSFLRHISFITQFLLKLSIKV